MARNERNPHEASCPKETPPHEQLNATGEATLELLAARYEESPYLVDAAAYFRLCLTLQPPEVNQSHGIIAKYSIAAGDRELAAHSIMSIPDSQRDVLWQLYAQASRSGDDPLTQECITKLGEARASDEDFFGAVKVKLCHVAEQLTNKWPTATDQASLEYHLNELQKDITLCAQDYPEISVALPETIAALVECNRVDDAQQLIASFEGTWQTETQELVTLHQARTGQLSTKGIGRLRQELANYQRGRNNEKRPDFAIVALLAADDPKVQIELAANLDWQLTCGYSQNLPNLTQGLTLKTPAKDFLRTYFPEQFTRWWPHVRLDYYGRHNDARLNVYPTVDLARQCPLNLAALCEAGHIDKAIDLYERLAGNVANISPHNRLSENTPTTTERHLGYFQLQAALTMAKYEQGL